MLLASLASKNPLLLLIPVAMWAWLFGANCTILRVRIRQLLQDAIARAIHDVRFEEPPNHTNPSSTRRMPSSLGMPS